MRWTGIKLIFILILCSIFEHSAYALRVNRPPKISTPMTEDETSQLNRFLEDSWNIQNGRVELDNTGTAKTNAKNGEMWVLDTSVTSKLQFKSDGSVFTVCNEGSDCTGGSSGNAFTTIQPTSGTAPVADSSTDTLTLTAGTNVTITGDSATDTITIASTGGSPGGADTNVQYNDSGSFGGDAGFTYDKTTSDATLAGDLIMTTSTTSLGRIMHGGNQFIYGNSSVTTLGERAGGWILGTRSVFIGEDAGANVGVTATENNFIGSDAGRLNTSGSKNIAIGADALETNKTTWYNIAIGNDALSNTTSLDGNNIAIGQSAMQNNGNYGGGNIAIGFDAMRELDVLTNAIETADYNIAIGETAMGNACNGVSGNGACFANVAVGSGALLNVTTGYLNQAYGYLAGQAITSGNNNIAIGSQALDDINIGSNNIGIGRVTLDGNNQGTNNVLIGNYSGKGLTNNFSSNNTCLGTYSCFTGSTAAVRYAGAIGYNAQVTASNNIVIGGTGTDAVSVAIGKTQANQACTLDVQGSICSSAGQIASTGITAQTRLTVQNGDGSEILTAQSAGVKITGGLQVTTLNCTGYSNDGALTADANGNIKCSDDDGGGAGGAPTTATYVTLSNDGTLSAERVLTAGTGIATADAGANSTITVSRSPLSSTTELTYITDESGTGVLMGNSSPSMTSPTVNTSFTFVSGTNVMTGAVGGINIQGDLKLDGNLNTTRAVNTTAPLSGGGALSSNRTLSITQSNSTTDGYLSSTDWNTFNNKVSSITATSPLNVSGGNNVFIKDSTGSASVVLNNSPTMTSVIVGTKLTANNASGAEVWTAQAGGVKTTGDQSITGKVTLSGYNCSTNANGGALTVDSSGFIKCTDDDTAAGADSTTASEPLAVVGGDVFIKSRTGTYPSPVVLNDTPTLTSPTVNTSFNFTNMMTGTTGGVTVHPPMTFLTGGINIPDGYNFKADGIVVRGPETKTICSSTTNIAEDQCDYVCDGVADEVQINQAINDIAGGTATGAVQAGAGGKGSIYFSEGTYTIAAPIHLKPGISLFGRGMTSTKIDVPNNYSNYIFDFQGTENPSAGVRVEGFYMNGNDSGQGGSNWSSAFTSGTAGVNLWDTHWYGNFFFDFKPKAHEGVLNINDPWGFRFVNNHIEDSNGGGYAMVIKKGAVKESGAIIYGNKIIQNERGIRLENVNLSILTNNEINTTGSDQWAVELFQNTGGAYGNGTILSNNAYVGGQNGVKIWTSVQSTVLTQNLFSGLSGTDLVNYGTFSVIQGNRGDDTVAKTDIINNIVNFKDDVTADDPVTFNNDKDAVGNFIVHGDNTDNLFAVVVSSDEVRLGTGGGSNYAYFDSDGDFYFTGTADYLVDATGAGDYAFRAALAENAGLYFGNSGYNFKDTNADTIFFINAIDGTETVTVGSTTGLGRFAVDGQANEVQLLVQGNATQTADIMVVENSAGTDIMTAATGGVKITGDLQLTNVMSATSTSTLGWTAKSATNTKGVDSCTYACVFCLASGGASDGTMVGCNDATADFCLCAGPN